MANEGIWPRVDQFMSAEDLTAAANRIRDSVDWSKLPKLAEIFQHRPPVNRYWHELVALTLLSLEVNGDVLAQRAVPEPTPPAEAKTEGDWAALLSAARNMLNAITNIYPGRSREEVEREAFQRLSAAVNAFSHPCAATEPKPPEPR